MLSLQYRCQNGRGSEEATTMSKIYACVPWAEILNLQETAHSTAYTVITEIAVRKSAFSALYGRRAGSRDQLFRRRGCLRTFTYFLSVVVR